MGRVIVMTLAFNLPSEVEARTRELYERNKGFRFEHYIVDLGFPLEYGSDIPENIEQAKAFNSILLKDTCNRHGSAYLKFPNVGVSQNYTQFIKAVELQDDDVLICCDPDEVVHTDNWVRALCSAISATSDRAVSIGGKITPIAWCGLMMEEQRAIVEKSEKEPFGVRHGNISFSGYIIKGITSCAQWVFSGKFLNEIGGMPVPDGAPVYGWIESALYEKLGDKWNWAILPEYIVEHTECSTLYREWKTDITSNVKDGQPSFEDWLKTKT
jgi:hypothetical protein